jgi:hypothetical protein
LTVFLPSPLKSKQVTVVPYFPSEMEHRIVADARQEVYKQLVDSGSKIDDLSELTTEQSIQACQKKLGEEIEWSDGIPVLKAVKPLVLGRAEAAAPS